MVTRAQSFWQRFYRSVLSGCKTSSMDSVSPVRQLRCILSCFLLIPFLSVLAEITINASTSRENIYLGESFNLTLEVNGADRDLSEPNLKSLPPAEVTFLGQHSNSRSSVTIINGRMTRESFDGRVYAYQIKPQTEGAYHTGPLQITFKGKTYTNPGITVQVKGIEQQDYVVAKITASSTSVLVEEPFKITLSVAIRDLPEPFAANNEPLHPDLLPHLSADFLEIKQEISGLKTPDLNQILNDLIDQSGRQAGFAINNYMTRDIGSGFGRLMFDGDPFKPRPIRFRLTPQRITINNQKYREYTLTLDYTPTKEGEFTFGPLTFKGTIIKDVSPDRKAVTVDIYTIGPAVTVRVIPPPDAGRPDCFTGSVGRNMQVNAAFDTSVCKVGDPLTLTLELTGAISVSNLRTPILNLQTNLTQNFRIYDDNVKTDTLPNGKRFKYRVRPTSEGTLEFPPIKLAYYDTSTGTYSNLCTDPIPIQARPTTQIATKESSNSSATGTLESHLRPLPEAITCTRQGVGHTSLLPPTRIMLPVLVLGPLACLLALLFKSLSNTFTQMRARHRRKSALRCALKRLLITLPPQHASHIARTYLAHRLDIHGAALTPFDCATLLRNKPVPQQQTEAFQKLLTALDEALYHPDPTLRVDETIQQLRTLLPQIDAAFNDTPAGEVQS